MLVGFAIKNAFDRDSVKSVSIAAKTRRHVSGILLLTDLSR